jgi:phosphoglycerol transferase
MLSGIGLSVTSLILFVVGFLLALTANFSRRARIVLGSATALYLFLLSFYLASDHFTGEGINQATLFHVRYGFQGAGFLEYLDIITTSVLLALLGIALFLWFLCKKTTPVRSAHVWIRRLAAVLLLILALLINPATVDIHRLTFPEKNAVAATHDFVDYYSPGEINPLPQDKRNLVFIYLESLEQTYFDDSLFPGLVDGLTGLESESIFFTDIGETHGAGWTIAGMVATQCGLPLYVPVSGNSMSGMDVLMPDALCLGDVLAAEGYRLSFYGGADLSFAGKGKFYSSHHFDEVKGRQELLAQVQDPDYLNSWGLFDDELFALSFKRFRELAGSGERFGLFLLTLDTHHPHGHPSASCSDVIYQDGTNPILNAVACSDHLVSRFVERIRSSEFGKDTVIVIASDHLAMRNTASDRLSKGQRRNLFMILDPALEQARVVDKKGTTLDVGTTLLPFLGYQGTIGLGRDLLGDTDSLAVEFPRLNKQLRSWQTEIEAFWSYPRIEQSLEVDADARAVRIDGRTFSVPVLLKLNEDLETELRFEIERTAREKKLLYQVRHFDTVTPFAWVDRCSQISEVATSRYDGDLCLAVGRMDNRYQKRTLQGEVVVIDRTFSFSAAEIHRMLFE